VITRRRPSKSCWNLELFERYEGCLSLGRPLFGRLFLSWQADVRMTLCMAVAIWMMYLLTVKDQKWDRHESSPNFRLETVMSTSKLHTDDTPVPVLAPGNGKTKTGRLWTYVRDDRPTSRSQSKTPVQKWNLPSLSIRVPSSRSC